MLSENVNEKLVVHSALTVQNQLVGSTNLKNSNWAELPTKLITLV